MELGKQIKFLRLQRGITQETLADVLGVSAQAVSKWEREAALPDMQLLPALSAYFGVTIDELFALSDETRMERIQNMLYDERVLDRAVAERETAFLLEKARREPENGRPHELLAELELHLAQEHRDRAAAYAKEALTREPDRKLAHRDLVEAMGGKLADWCAVNHRELIDWYKDFVERHPHVLRGYLWLMDQLIDDQRFDEARVYCERMAAVDGSFCTPLYRGLICWHEGNRDKAMSIWEQMCRDWPEDWMVSLSMGDAMVRAGRYEEARDYYRRALEIQEPPRYTDGADSIAQLCELQGDYSGAIAAQEEVIALLAREWSVTSGEQVDFRRREIQRLRAKKG
ncbi:MAG: helix-turn-helix domain-containing protein [Oscillospiraceae bacterium]